MTRSQVRVLDRALFMVNKGKAIGVFDSGFGGLDILKGITKGLPRYDYVYLGDSARTPYGSRSPQLVYEFAKEAVDFLFSKGCGLVIFACNTASSGALRKIQREYLPRRYAGKKVLGVLIPAAEEAAAITKNKKVAVMATAGTVASGAFPREFKKLDRKIKVFQKACPLLVPLVESGEYNSKAAESILRGYMKPLLSKKPDTIILGCTHYGILENKIRKIAGRNIRVISEKKVVPKKLKNYLKKHPEIEKKLGLGGRREFYATDLSRGFEVLGSRFFGRKIRPKRAVLG